MGTMVEDHDVFISYGTQKQAIAVEISNRLEKSGLRCWISPEISHRVALMPKQSWKLSINASVRTITLPRKKNLITENDKGVDINLSALQIGKVIFAGVSGELMNEIGMEIKKKSPFTHTLILTHCIGSSGYIITDEAYDGEDMRLKRPELNQVQKKQLLKDNRSPVSSKK
jgi:hypothetical protein